MTRDTINIGTYKYLVDYHNSIDLDIQYYKNFVFIRNYDIFNDIIIDTDIYFIERDFYFSTIRKFLIESIDASKDMVFPIPFTKLTGYSINYNDFNGLYSKNSFYNSIENVYKHFLEEGNKDCGIKSEIFKEWIKTCKDKYIIGKEVYELYDKYGNITSVKCDKIKIYSPLMENNIDHILHIDNYINNINFHYFCGDINMLNRNSEMMFELNHNTYAEYYELYIPNVNYLFSGEVFFNEDLNIQIAEENKGFLQRISSNSYLTKNLLVLKGYKFEDINIALKNEINNNPEIKENVELFYYESLGEDFKILDDSNFCWLRGKIFGYSKVDGLPIIKVNPEDIVVPEIYQNEADKISLINKYATTIYFGIFAIDISDTIDSVNKIFIEKYEDNDLDETLLTEYEFYKLKNILLLNIYNENVVYNEDNQKVNHLFVYNTKHNLEGLEGLIDEEGSIVYRSSNRGFKIFTDEIDENGNRKVIFSGKIVGVSDFDGSPIIETDNNDYDIEYINKYGSELFFGDISLNIVEHFHDRSFQFDYLFDILSLKSLAQPFKIIERTIDGDLVNIKQYIKQNNSVYSNYMNIPLGVSLFPYCEINEETNLYILDDNYDTNEISFVTHCDMTLACKLGFNENNCLSICCDFQYKDIIKFDSFKDAYFYYNDVTESEYNNYKETMLDNLRENIEEIYGLTDPKQIDSYIETYKEEVLEEFGVSFDFIGIYIGVYTDDKMTNSIWNKKYIIDIKDLKDSIDVPIDMSDIFSSWKQLPNKLLCNIKFFDQYLGNIIYGNLVVITKEWFKYVINDTTFNIFENNNKQIKYINDNMKTITLSDNNVNFINNITCNIIKDNGNNTTNHTVKQGLNNPRLLYKPYFYKVQDLQKINLRTGLKQNIGIDMVQYMTKVTLFKLVINGNEYKEIGRNDVYVIFGIDAMDINQNTGKYDIFNQDDEYISSGEYNLY
jgi:hypothetical protein